MPSKVLSSLLPLARRSIGCIFLLFLALGAARAQTTEGSIRGYIRDEQGGVLPGVKVTAKSEQSPTPLSAVSDREGQYRLLDVPPGTYELMSEMPGFEKLVRANIIIHAGLNVTIDMALKVGALSETVTVRGDAPLLETKDAGQSVSVTGEVAQSLPLGPQKHWSEFIRFTPGAVSRDATNNQAPVFYIHGSGIVSSSTLIDGADMTSAINPWLGYTGLPADTVADVQLKTSGVDASAPLGMGLAANVLTTSGTNAFHGSGTFTSAPGSWVGNNVTGGTASSAGITQPEASIGGPIVRDRAWFFGSYRYRGGFLGINRPASQVTAMQALDPNFKSFNNQFSNANIFFVKANVQLSSKHQLSTFYNHDSTPYGTATPFYTGAFSSTKIGGDGYAARITSAWNSWLLSRATFSWNNKSAAGFLASTSPISQNVFQTIVTSSGQLVGTTQLATLGNAPSATQSPYSKWTITGDVTVIRGAHEIQAGIFLQPHMVRLDTITYVNGGNSLAEYVLLNASNPAGGTALFHKRVYAVGSGVIDKGHFSDNAVYIQDSWRATSRLTVNAGIRFDHVGRFDDLFNVQLQNSWQIGPRAGVNYLITKDARHAVRASYTRLADAASINAQSASGSGTQGSSATTIGYTDYYAPKLDGNFSSVFVTPSATAASPSLVPDPGYHQPYVDEFAVGYRRQFPGQLYFDVGYIQRYYRDRTALVEQNGIYNGNVFAGYKNVDQNAIYLLTNNKWNWPVYQALEIVAAKQTSKLQILASYTQVFPHLAGTWQPNDPAFFIQPAAFSLNRGLLSNDNRSPSANNGLDITSTGTSSIEWTQQIGRANVVYHAPWSFLASASYTYQNGHYSGPVFTKLAAPDPQFGPTTVTLSNGRVVANPLATTARFAFPTRSDGQFELPAAHYINLRGGRVFKFEKYSLAANLDVFNVPNLGHYQALLSGANLVYSSNYGLGGEVQPPRSYQVEVKFQF
jgi:Carboxypeptidase regulatory-like domain/TonB dependent receptor